MLNLIDKKILIYGFGISGKACLNFLYKNNSVIVYDDKIKRFKNKNIKFLDKKALNKIKLDYIVLSPGINIKNCSLKNFLKKNKKKIISELDIFYCTYKSNIKVAITGTNGKSTTCKLLYDILKKSNKDVRLVGNIGSPLLNEKKINKKTIFVIEVSSYQIGYSSHFKSDIAVILNIAPDHLERHDNFLNYVKVKSQLILNQNFNSRAIICDNNKVLDKYLKSKKINAKIYKIGASVNNIYLKKIKNDYFNNINNQENLNFVIKISKLLKIKNSVIIKAINKFKPLKYRQEIIYNNKKFLIINDSKSTSFSSTVNLLKNYKNIYWILGGLNKKGDKINLPKNSMQNIKGYIIGKDKSFFVKKLKNKIKIKKITSLKNALGQVMKDIKFSNLKANIIFSPSAASFDQFKNFEERGKYFNNLVKKIFYKAHNAK